MQIVVDPWVLVKAFDDEECARKLATIEGSKADFCLIITETLKNYYAIFLNERASCNNAQLAIAFAKHLVSRTAFKNTLLTPNSSLLKFIDSDCDCHVEDLDHHLLEIVVDRCEAKTRREEVPIVLLLDCVAGDNCSAAKSRCLSRERCRLYLQQRFPDLSIVCAGDRKSSIKVVSPGDKMNNQQHAARFEDECARWLERKEGIQVERGVNRWQHEIDILYETDGLVYIGECKLVHGGNAHLRQEEALRQLEERICAASNQGLHCKWNAFLFCSESFEQQIYDKSNNIKMAFKKSHDLEIEFKFIRVKMPQGWKDRPDWRLSESDFEQT